MIPRVILLSIALLLIACSRTATQEFQPRKDSSKPHIHNLIQVSPRIYSGAEPHGAETFEELKSLGVKAVISVDGAQPDVEAARAAGLRYIHIPIGYDGVPKSAQASLARAMKEVDGPVYVHCHHGRHRGPAAAAIAWCADQEVSEADRLALLKLAGTSKDYEGLWRDVVAFDPAAVNPETAELVEIARLETFTASMALLDRTFDRVKEIRAAGWKTPEGHADLSPTQETTILWESFREMQRTVPEAQRDEQMLRWLAESESQALLLRDALKAGDIAAAESAFKVVSDGCKQCHHVYRD